MPKRKIGKRRKQWVPKSPKRRAKGPRRRERAPIAPVGQVERVLALDSSSRACGWSVMDDGVLVAHGCYIQKGPGHGERLMRFRLWLLDMLREWQPRLLVYEAPYQGRMKNTFGILSRYVGAIESAHFEYYEREIEKSESVPAHLVKKAIGARKGENHEANKKIVVLLVNETFGLGLKFKANDTTKKVSQDDEADAIALNWAWHRLNREADVIPEAA